MAAVLGLYMATTTVTTGFLPASTSQTAAVAPLIIRGRPSSLNAGDDLSLVRGRARAPLPAPSASNGRDDVTGDNLPRHPPAVHPFHVLPIPLGRRRCLAAAAASLFLAPLSLTGGPPAARGAVLEADDDVELLEKVKKDRKKRLERQGVVSSSGRETGYLQELVYKLSKVGQAIDNNDLSAAGTILGPDANAEWVQNVNAAFAKLSSSPEEKIEVDAFNTSLVSLISSVAKKDAESSKLAFVTSASSLEKWVTMTGLVAELTGL